MLKNGKKPLKILEAFLQLDGVEEFIKKCNVPKVDGNINPLQLEIEDFKILVEMLEEYSELKSVGAKSNRRQIEQWETKIQVVCIEITC